MGKFLHQPGGRQDVAHPRVIVGSDVVVDLLDVDVGDPGDISKRRPKAIVGPRGITGIVKIGEGIGVAVNCGDIAERRQGAEAVVIRIGRIKGLSESQEELGRLDKSPQQWPKESRRGAPGV